MPLTKDHFINLKNGAFDATTKSDLDHLFTNFSADPRKPPLVIHFHGGLVSEPTGMKVANNLMPVYESAGGYPVFFVWESGLIEVLSHNLQEIMQENIFQQLLKKVTQFAVAKLKQPMGTRGSGYMKLPTESEVKSELSCRNPYASLDVVMLPPDEVLQSIEEQQFKERLELDPGLEVEINKIANSFRPEDEVNADHIATRGLNVRGSTHTWMSPDLINEIRKEESATGGSRGIITSALIVKHAITVLKRFVVRWASGRHHGVYATLCEELFREFYLAHAGGAIWSAMKKDTEDAFQSNPEEFGGTAFLEGIKKHWQEGIHPRIILIGHSTGAVYICNLLKFAEQRLPPEIKFDVAFLAPACTFDMLAGTLKTAAGRINGIRSFAMKDELEKADHVVPKLPIIYPHSLLYFVSGVVEDEADKPIVGMQRFFTGAKPFNSDRFPSVQECRSFFGQKPDRTIWSVQSSGKGCNSRSKHHTDFDEDPDTLESLSHIISQGL